MACAALETIQFIQRMEKMLIISRQRCILRREGKTTTVSRLHSLSRGATDSCAKPSAKFPWGLLTSWERETCLSILYTVVRASKCALMAANTHSRIHFLSWSREIGKQNWLHESKTSNLCEAFCCVVLGKFIGSWMTLRYCCIKLRKMFWYGSRK